MTLEYLEIMEELKKQEQGVQGAATTPRRKLRRAFKSNTKIYDDDSIEVTPQEKGEFLLIEPGVRVKFSAKERRVVAWLTFDAKGLIELRRELYNLTSKIDKCLVINEAYISPQN